MTNALSVETVMISARVMLLAGLKAPRSPSFIIPTNAGIAALAASNAHSRRSNIISLWQ